MSQEPDDSDPDASNVLDEAEKDEVTPAIRYDITSYGSDPDVEGLVRRLRKNDILIPPFQRDYVWHLSEASRFIESLLLGLPVPGIFLATEPETNRLLVIDGQQRLKSLLFFFDGAFNPKADEKRTRVFALMKVQKRFEGKTYKTLEEKDRIRLDNSIIHATIVKQNAPPGDDTSVFHIFERLNSGGRRLTTQEIRVALYHGTLLAELKQWNQNAAWRSIFGKPSTRLKDQELILRFLALSYRLEHYARPMSEFINKFCGTYKNAQPEVLSDMAARFTACIQLFANALGDAAFRPARVINAAVLDSSMVGLSRRLESGHHPTSAQVLDAYVGLLKNPDFIETTSRSTADDAFVRRRIQIAIDAFAG